MRVGVNVDRFGSYPPAELAAAGVTVARMPLLPDHDLTDYLTRLREQGIWPMAVIDSSSVGDHDWDYIADHYATKYGHLVACWQIGNESDHDPERDPESPSSWPLAGSNLTQLLRAFRSALPDAYLIGPGLVRARPEYLDGVDLSLINAISVHPYGKRPAADWPDPNWGTGYIDDLLAAHLRFSKPIWITEFGLSATEVTTALQAEYVGRMLRKLPEWEIKGALWFCWSDYNGVPKFGLHTGTGRPRPALATFKAAAHEIGETGEPTMPVPEPSPGPTEPVTPAPWTRERIIALSNRLADEHGIPHEVMLGCAIAESDLNPTARRPRDPAQDREYWPDVSMGLWQQTVRWSKEYAELGGDGSFPDHNVVHHILSLYANPEHAGRVAAPQIKHYLNQEGNALNALCRYNWPAKNPYENPNRTNYQRGLTQARAILGDLQPAPEPPVGEPPHVTYGRAILQAVEPEIGKRYAGPVIGEPDSYRWGNPGWDCSSLVSTAVNRASGGAVKLTAYTDAMFDQTLAIDPNDSVPGDLIFYYGYEDGQAAYYKHVGILAGPDSMLDAQFGKGVGYHPILNRPYVLRRARGAPAVPVPQPEPVPEEELAPIIGYRQLADVTIPQALAQVAAAQTYLEGAERELLEALRIARQFARKDVA